jgi:hypothetical protein
MPAGDVFGLDGFFLNVSNPITVSAVDINSTAAGAGITVTAGSFSSGTVTLTFDTAAGLSTTPFYVGAKIAVSGLSTAGAAYTGYNGNFVVTGFAGTTTVSYATIGYVGSVDAGITTTGLVILVTDTAVTNTTWSSTQTHGWFGGGITPGAVSTVDRIDFSNDTGTANIRGPLSSTRYRPAATGNSNYGWFGGGYNRSTVDRIDFSNDNATASPRGSLSRARNSLAATGNSNYGWFGGGTSPIVSTVERIDFSNDSGTALPRSPLFASRYRLAATGNSNYGWFGGGYGSGAFLSRVDRIDFSNDSTTASPRGPLSAARRQLAATGNSNYGWFGGGTITGTSGTLTIDRIDFSNDNATAAPRGSLSSARYKHSATGNSNYGWFGGGTPGSGFSSIVDRIDFSNDSVSASVRGPLSSPGGSPGGRAELAATSGQARSSSVRLQKAGNYGWFGGGKAVSPLPLPVYSRVDRIDFSNDSTTASIRGPLSLQRYDLAATGNSNYGWFAGGNSTASPRTTHATVDRIDFSNDSTTASIRGPLSGVRYAMSATGNSNYGWFTNGYDNAAGVRTALRIDFANDSSTTSPRTLMPVDMVFGAATGNSNYGWFGGGANGTPLSTIATVQRIDFSNDGTSPLSRGPLSQQRFLLAATGNSNYGWFGGGYSSGYWNLVDRIDFSNDSVQASVRGPSLRHVDELAATGNSNYGWFGGGYLSSSPFLSALVNRINFSNDAVTASPRGSLSLARERLAATSNTPVG